MHILPIVRKFGPPDARITTKTPILSCSVSLGVKSLATTKSNVARTSEPNINE